MLRPQHTEQVVPYVDDSCKLLLHMNGQSGTQQFIDSSNNPKVVTTYSNACLSNSHYRFGGTSAYFDGTGDYLTVPNSTDWDLSNGFTISFWIRSSNIVDIAGLIAYGDTNPITWRIRLNSSGYINLAWMASATVSGTSNVCDSNWHHICFTRDSNGVMNLYVDGNYQATATSTVPCDSGAFLLYIGNNYNYLYNGYIDELIIWKGIAKPIGELYPQRRPYGYPIGGT